MEVEVDDGDGEGEVDCVNEGSRFEDDGVGGAIPPAVLEVDDTSLAVVEVKSSSPRTWDLWEISKSK